MSDWFIFKTIKILFILSLAGCATSHKKEQAGKSESKFGNNISEMSLKDSSFTVKQNLKDKENSSFQHKKGHNSPNLAPSTEKSFKSEIKVKTEDLIPNKVENKKDFKTKIRSVDQANLNNEKLNVSNISDSNKNKESKISIEKTDDHIESFFIDDNNFDSTGNSRTKRVQTGLSLGKSRSLISKEGEKTDDFLIGMRKEKAMNSNIVGKEQVLKSNKGIKFDDAEPLNSVLKPADPSDSVKVSFADDITLHRKINKETELESNIAFNDDSSTLSDKISNNTQKVKSKDLFLTDSLSDDEIVHLKSEELDNSKKNFNKIKSFLSRGGSSGNSLVPKSFREYSRVDEYLDSKRDQDSEVQFDENDNSIGRFEKARKWIESRGRYKSTEVSE